MTHFNTNFIAISSDVEAPNPNYKCFVRWISESFIKGTLYANPTLYLDVLEEFWRSATYEETALEDGTHGYLIHCKIQGIDISFGTEEMNKALGLSQGSYAALAKDQELVEFFEFIRYSGEIKLGLLKRNCLRKEWSFVFATLLQVFTARKSSFDHLSAPVQQIGYSLAYGRKINVGNLIMQELCGRLGQKTAKKGMDIFFPRFIQSVINFINTEVIESPGIDKQRIGYPKSMTKLIFGNLDTRNDVDVRLEITPHMQELFLTYPHNMPTFESISGLARAKLEVQKAIPSPATLPQHPNTLPNTLPPASSAQQGDVSQKKKKRKGITVEPLKVLTVDVTYSQTKEEES